MFFLKIYLPSALILLRYILNDNKFSGLRKICIIGDMLELGKMSKDKHVKIVKPLLKVKPEIVITVGNHSKAIYGNVLTIHLERNKARSDGLAD